MTPSPEGDVVQIGEHGPLFRLRPPHTPSSLRDEVASVERRPWFCRRGLHLRIVVGDVHVPDDDLVAATCALIASANVSALTRCRRCRAVYVRYE